jgi:glycosyltransferase involved in cell wall biosynthesis
LSALSKAFAIDVVGVCRSTYADPSAVTRELGVRSTALYPDEAPRTMRPQRFSGKLVNLFASGAYPVDLLDAVHVEGGYLFHLLPATYHGRVCLVEHNIESNVLRQFAVLLDDPKLVRASHRVARMEDRSWRAAATVVAVTSEDQAEIMRRSGRTDVVLVPNGSDHIPAGPLIAPPVSAPPTALLLANFEYPPNADALRVTLEELWPRVIATVPDAQLLLAGIGMSEAQQQAAGKVHGVEVVGFVDDVSTVFDRADVLVCPLRAGGGVKVKVVESIRRGCPVVTTTIGAQGINGQARSALRVADSVTALAAETTDLLRACEQRVERRMRTLWASADLVSWAEASTVLARTWERLGNP